MKIDHAAMYVKDLEAARAFFETYFGAAANAKYRNPSSGLETYFLTFASGARLEVMRRPGLAPAVEGRGRDMPTLPSRLTAGKG